MRTIIVLSPPELELLLEELLEELLLDELLELEEELLLEELEPQLPTTPPSPHCSLQVSAPIQFCSFSHPQPVLCP